MKTLGTYLTYDQMEDIAGRVMDQITTVDWDYVGFSEFTHIKGDFYKSRFFNTKKTVDGVVYVHAYIEGNGRVVDFAIVNVTGTGFHVDQDIFAGYDYGYWE